MPPEQHDDRVDLAALQARWPDGGWQLDEDHFDTGKLDIGAVSVMSLTDSHMLATDTLRFEAHVYRADLPDDMSALGKDAVDAIEQLQKRVARGRVAER